VFTTPNFLCNLWISPISWMFVHGKPFQPSVMQHSTLLGPYISYEENEVLWVGPEPEWQREKKKFFNTNLKMHSGLKREKSQNGTSQNFFSVSFKYKQLMWMTVLKIIWHNAERSVRERERERGEKRACSYKLPPSLPSPTHTVYLEA